MMTHDNDKELKISNIQLKDLIDTLVELQSSGVNIIDFIVTKNTEKDILGIVIREENSVPKKPVLTDEDINHLLS